MNSKIVLINVFLLLAFTSFSAHSNQPIYDTTKCKFSVDINEEGTAAQISIESISDKQVNLEFEAAYGGMSLGGSYFEKEELQLFGKKYYFYVDHSDHQDGYSQIFLQTDVAEDDDDTIGVIVCTRSVADTEVSTLKRESVKDESIKGSTTASLTNNNAIHIH